MFALAAALLLLVHAPTAQDRDPDEVQPAHRIPYDRPDPAGTPTKVRAAIFVVDIVKVDGVEQSFTADFFVALQWRDPRLAYVVEPGAPFHSEPLTSIWNPRIQVINKRKLWKEFAEDATIEPDGTATCIQRYYGELSCPADLSDFPFDRRTFEVRLVSIGNTPSEVELVPDERIGRAPSFSVPDWDVVAQDVRVGSFQAPSLPVPFASLSYAMEGKRRSRFYLFKTIVPLVMIILMSWAVFWIDPSLVASQIGVATTAVLTLIAHNFSTTLILPRVPYLTRMDKFTLSSSVLVFLALAEAVTTSFLARRKPNVVRRVDLVCRVLFPIAFAGILFASFG